MTDDDKRLMPLVVTSSTGVGGVSPRVSFVQDQRHLEQAVEPAFGVPSFVPAAFDPAAVEIIEIGIEKMAHSLEGILKDTAYPMHSMRETLLEAVRVSAEDALHFFQDLAVAKSPADFYSMQAEYLGKQAQSVAHHTEELQAAFGAFFSENMRRVTAGFTLPFQFWASRV